ncbi:MAG: MMPL family transporter [Gammaproteobacteria bacterium]|nr:MMPL family transporter [Gammaproteobacteria bacterium]
MFKFAIEKPVILTVIILIVCLFGVLSIFRVPIQMIPDLDVRAISVNTSWPGATPQDVEKEIIIEQEEYLRRIPSLERMISHASTGNAEIELEFPSGTDINEVLIRVNNALSQVPGYPENVDEPRIITSSYSNNPFLFFRVTALPGNPENVRILQTRDFLEDHVRTQMERVAGVSEVQLWGGAERQVKIYVDPIKLAERELRLIDVRNAIRARNKDVSGGDLDSGKRRYLLRTVGRFSTVEEIEKLAIGRRGDAFIRLSDVGYAELSNFELRSYSYSNGEPSITMGVRRQVGSNVVEVMDAMLEKVDVLNEDLLKRHGLVMALTSDDVQYVRDSVSNVRRNLILGGLLATLVLFLFLRSFSATFTGAIGIPICTIAAFLGLLISARTINVISLAGIAFAIGMTLDNSIVVLENIYRHLNEGKNRVQAALDGVREVWPAVLASTLTTVFVFAPVIFIKEEVGQLYSDIAVAVSAAILMSMLVAVTLIPAACSRFLQPANETRMGSDRLKRFGIAFSQVVIRFVSWCTSKTERSLALIVIMLTLVAMVIVYLTPRAEYLPEGEEQKIFAFIFAPPGYNIDEMHAIQKNLNEYFVPYVGDEPARFDRGESEVPALRYFIGYASAGRVMMIPEAISRSQIEELKEVVNKKIQDFPGVIAFASRGSIFSSNTGGSRSINLELSGTDLVSLFDAGFKAFIKSRQIFENPQVRPQPSSLSLGQPLLEIRPDWERAQELAIDTEDLGYTVWAYSDGAYVDEFFLGDDKIDMFLFSTQGAIERPQDLDKIMLYSSEGGIVPLSSIASVKETVNTETIRRVDGARTITLGIVPPRNVPLETGVEMVRRDLIDSMRASGEVSNDIHMQITGASDDLKATRSALAGNFMIAIIISYLLMVAIFSHWGYPLLIVTTVPVGIAGSIFGLWLMNSIGAHLDLLGLENILQPFDVITMLGFLILIGTVVNNPILLVDRTIRNIDNRKMGVNAAILESTKARLRPIMMSSITTVCGLSPLVFTPGAGTELYRGLGAIVLFGLLFSTVVTLTFIPAVLSLVLQFRQKLLA